MKNSSKALEQKCIVNPQLPIEGPQLPIEGILLTLRLGSNVEEAKRKIANVETLLSQIAEDSRCQYLLVLALDNDERNSQSTTSLIKRLEHRERKCSRFHSFQVIWNDPRAEETPFEICSVWNQMAIEAWESGAYWVIMLGDDINIECSNHYRAIFRAFLDIESKMNVPFGFGCPWWNDRTFPGFPSFPCVGKAHYKIFNSLVLADRSSDFVNQDLDPYLHRMYSKFMAAPCVTEARLTNRTGGNREPRYERIPAKGWQDFASQDLEHIREYLPNNAKEAILVDVVVPSYRIKLEYLSAICCLQVPEYMHTIFIIIVDNPELMIERARELSKTRDNLTLYDSERILEKYLSQSGNIVRVRCNSENLGASASRNRGLDESGAEFILNLDDDLIPNPDLLKQYGKQLLNIDDSIVGLIGLVRFPREEHLPLKHAAVLMSYLTFMFEIAEQDLYPNPAWGVTANILFRRTPVRFDLIYAKTGGGEDVDFSLNVSKASGGGKLIKVKDACVVHPFWPGSILSLCSHFFNWPIGDCCLYIRFPDKLYWSFPNVSETLFLLLFLSWWIGPKTFLQLAFGFVLIDFFVDISNLEEFKHRCQLLHSERNICFYIAAHALANIYVVVLECGRIYGHLKQFNLHTGIFRRFDWHCGQLENAPRDFRNREKRKFVLFLVFSVYILFDIGARVPPIVGDTCASSWNSLSL